MKHIKPILFTVLGMAIGATVVLTASRVEATQQFERGLRETVGSRVVITPITGHHWAKLATVKDTKSGGCWIASGYVDKVGFSSLAVAPPTACD
jgi:hypothetical protein